MGSGGRRALLLSLLTACSSAYAGRDAPGDAGAIAPADAASALDASPGADADPGDASDGAPRDATFCAAKPGALLCYDFDGTSPLATLATSMTGGAIAVEPTFAGGSTPNALVAQASAVGGRAIATLPTLDLTKLANQKLLIDFRFSTVREVSTVEYLARLNFTAQSSPIALTSTNTLQCGSGTVPLAQGAHEIAISVSIDGTGAATSFTCQLDQSAPSAASVQASTGLSLELGNATSGSGSFTVAYDDVVVTAQ